MPKKPFVLKKLKQDEIRNLSHMEIVARSKPLLEKVVGMVKDMKYSKRNVHCRESTRALKEIGQSKYPVVSCRVRCSDSGPTGQGKKLTLACHAVMLLAKLRKASADCPLWSKDQVVSHKCHNTLCYRSSHLILETVANNNSRNIHCFGYVKCQQCRVRLRICTHNPVCTPVRKSICSNCTNRQS